MNSSRAASQSRVLSLRNFDFILSSAPCFVKRARIAAADSPLRSASLASSFSSSSSVTSIFSAVAMRSSSNLRLHIVARRAPAGVAHGHPVHIDSARVNSLRRQRANHAFQAHVHLMLDQRFGNREIVALDELGQNLFARLRFLMLLARGIQTFANFAAQLFEVGGTGASPIPWRIRRSARAASFL